MKLDEEKAVSTVRSVRIVRSELREVGHDMIYILGVRTGRPMRRVLVLRT